MRSGNPNRPVILITGLFIHLLFSSYAVLDFDFKFVTLTGFPLLQAPEEIQTEGNNYQCIFKLDTLDMPTYNIQLELKNMTGDTLVFQDLGNSGGHFITTGVSDMKIAPKKTFKINYGFMTIGRENSFVTKSKPVIFGGPKGVHRVWLQFSGFVKAPAKEVPVKSKN